MVSIQKNQITVLLAPFEDFYMVSPLKPKEAEAALATEVGPNPRSTTAGGYFQGYVMNGTFKLQPNVIYRNSFNPQIKGAIEPWLDGSRVHVKMNLQPFAIIFMCICVVFLTCAGITMLVNNVNKPLSASSFLPWGMIIFAYILATGAFKAESIKAKAQLFYLLDAELG